MQESIWGTVNLMIEIALHIYMVYAENGSGIVMPKEKADQFSEETVKQAVEDGDKLYFKSGAPMDAVMGELLEKRRILAKKVEDQCTKFMQMQKEKGTASMETLPAPSGKEKLQNVRNGIYISKDEEKIFIHKDLAEVYLSPYALEFSETDNGYYCFSGNTVSIPLYELHSYFPELKDMIVQEESLINTLNTNYQAYVERMNSVLPDAEKIPRTDGVPNLFLQSQLDRLEQIEAEGKPEEEMVFEEMEEFGEKIEYAFEL